MGMTDSQFKSYLNQVIKRLEAASDAGEKDEIKQKLGEVIQDLKDDMAR